jgi:hypothetical protein
MSGQSMSGMRAALELLSKPPQIALEPMLLQKTEPRAVFLE